ncbi:MAG: hypothetical protein AAF570_20780, partial [Bacteroidota bacterium]
VFGCRTKPQFFVEEGTLSFSTDTVFFDTIFTGFPSPTERLVVTNKTGKNVRISDISFENGTEYDLIFDGIDSDSIQDYELANGDSAVAFINFTSGEMDAFTRDRLVFTVGDETQRVDIEAFVFDALFYRDTILGGFGGPTMTVWQADQKYVIDGCLQVPDGHTLWIEAGTQVYFTPRKDANFNLISSIKVFGRLIVKGTVGNEVVFQQTRFGNRYDETPGQWRGIAFANISRSNTLEHCIVKNGLIGIYQEFQNDAPAPKVGLESVEIRNMGAYGILSVGYQPLAPNHPQIRARNSLIHNCAEATLAIIGGGHYQFEHCTFVNYTMDFTRNSPQMLLNNYDPDELVVFPMKTRFRNCIIWGSEEEEVVPDSFPVVDAFDVTLDDCLARTTLELKGSNIKTSEDFDFPKFVAPTEAEADERDYRLKAWSPAVNEGADLPWISVDLDDKPRDSLPDIGCYEYSE